MSEKTSWRKVFNSDYLSSADVEEKDIILTIKSVSIDDVKGADGKNKKCNVARFAETGVKPMILNVTNSKIVKKFAGSRYLEDWKNIPVQLYVDDKVKAFGEVTEGLRIRSQQPRIGKSELLPNTEQWTNARKYLQEGGAIKKILEKYTISEANQIELVKP
jgi:hypothetical protein